jgi:hypothetical protein
MIDLRWMKRSSVKRKVKTAMIGLNIWGSPVQSLWRHRHRPKKKKKGRSLGAVNDGSLHATRASALLQCLFTPFFLFWVSSISSSAERVTRLCSVSRVSPVHFSQRATFSMPCPHRPVKGRASKLLPLLWIFNLHLRFRQGNVILLHTRRALTALPYPQAHRRRAPTSPAYFEVQESTFRKESALRWILSVSSAFALQYFPSRRLTYNLKSRTVVKSFSCGGSSLSCSCAFLESLCWVSFASGVL